MTSPAVPSTGALHAPPLRPEGIGWDSPTPAVHGAGLQVRRRGWARLAVFLAVTAVAATITGVVGHLAGLDQFQASIAAELVGAIAGYVALVAFEGRLNAPLELHPRRALTGLAAGLALGAVLMSAVIGILWVIGLWHFHGIDHSYTVTRAAWHIFSVGAVAGVAEEIFFRGVLHRMVEAHLGTWLATGISGLIFGLMHLGNPQATWWGALAIAAEAGVLFGVIYSLTRSLWVLFGLHAAWNVVQGPIFGAVVSGSSERGHGFLLSSHSGPDLVTGGSFGPEASVVSVALLVALAVALIVRLHRSGAVIRPFWCRARDQRQQIS